MTGAAMLWTAAASAGAVSLTAGLAERRRARRRDIDRVGWVPWTLVQVIALALAAILAAYAIKL
ncbi:MAG: hypothetical protein JWN69_1583 [Alphaproteobacteria bacterium]|nr:hypothetical protein [Alphaproteobacteria bacterium]